MIGFSEPELRLLAWLVRVAQQVVPANHVAAPAIPAILARLTAIGSCSPTRTPDDDRPPEFEQDNMIGTAEAARRLGVTRRAIQQRIERGRLPADRIGQTWAIREDDL